MSEIYVAATVAGGLEDQVSQVFGRTPTFTVVEVEDGKISRASVIPNPYGNVPSGAGIQAAQLVAEKSPRAAFAGDFGPNVAGVLSQAGIEMIPVSGITVRQAVEQYLSGRLAPMSGAYAGPGFGPGMGRGMGRGMGYGAGMGRGMGRGMGGFGTWGFGPGGYPPQAGFASPEDVTALRERIGRLEAELSEAKRKLEALKGGG